MEKIHEKVTSQFSIIIPTYNSAGTLEVCINSILSQTFQDFEIVIIDGLSVDNTLSIAYSYNNVRIKVFSEKDQGIYDAMNKGITQAYGMWVYFLGSDDIFYSNFVLQDVYNYAKHVVSDVIYGDIQFLKSRAVYGGASSIDRLLHDENIPHQAIFYKREIFEKLGYYNLSYNLFADWEFNIRCFRHPDFKRNYINKIIGIYNEEGNSSRHNCDEEPILKQIPKTYISEIQLIKNSMSYKVGKTIVEPLRYIRDKLLFSNRLK